MPEPLNVASPREFHSHSELFTVRLWREDQGEGHVEWRGKMQHVLSGETRYFRDWQVLLAFIQETRPAAVLDGQEHPPLNTQD